ncbi:MAG: hypothetical protein IPL63_16845 [Saprospiraceae bacterium]|nr:hypothetical protein [Saprospiraceae bacterium]
MSRSSWYYKSRLNDSEIVTKLEEMVENYPNRGFENYYHRIRREGIKWAWCRILRVYREMGLVRRTKKRFYLPDAQESLYNKWNAIMKHGVWTSRVMHS